MTKMVAWVLGLVMLLGIGAAAAESALTEIPAFEGTLNVRAITSEEEAIAYAKEFLALDYIGVDASNAEYLVSEYWMGENCYQVDVNLGGTGNLMVAFDPEGNVVAYDNAACGFYYLVEAAQYEEEGAESEEWSAGNEMSEEEEAALVAWRETLDRKMEYPFLSEVNPEVYEEYIAEHPLNEGSNEFLTHYYGTYYDDVITEGAVYDLNYSETYYLGDSYRIKIGVQTSPVVRIVHFDVFCNPEEGGNG